MKYIIDYFTFLIKPDEAADEPQTPTIEFIYEFLDLLHLCDSFTCIPGKHHYAACHLYENIRIYDAFPGREKDMGIMVELSGQACRFIEADYQERYGVAFSWADFAHKLITLTSVGYSLNISRIDFAFDDYYGLLQLDEIERCAENREYVSLFRSRPVELKGGESIPWSEIISMDNTKSAGSTGRTIYFGSKKSNTYCRFYDKKVEQMYKNRNNPDVLEKLEKINHWVRFEIVFRKKPANSLLMSLASLNGSELFSKYLSEVINGYIRFIDIDDTNVTRCTVKAWWAEFLGTAERSTLTCPGVKHDPLTGAVYWLNNSLAPTLAALIYRLGKDKFLDIIFEDHPEERFTAKHKEIINGSTDEVVSCALKSSEVWARFLPDVVLHKLLEIQEAEEAFASEIVTSAEQLTIL